MTEAYGDDVKVAPMMAVLNYRRDVARILKSAYDLGMECLRRRVLSGVCSSLDSEASLED